MKKVGAVVLIVVALVFVVVGYLPTGGKPAPTPPPAVVVKAQAPMINEAGAPRAQSPSQERGIDSAVAGKPSSMFLGLVHRLGGNGVLGETELAELQQVLAKFEMRKYALEESRVQQTGWDSHTLVLTIPPYAEEGRLLRTEFLAELSARIGRENMLKLDAECGKELDLLFDNYGASTQTFQVTRVDRPDYVKIRKEVEFQDSGIQSAWFAGVVADKTATWSFSSSFSFAYTRDEPGRLRVILPYITKTFGAK